MLRSTCIFENPVVLIASRWCCWVCWNWYFVFLFSWFIRVYFSVVGVVAACVCIHACMDVRTWVDTKNGLSVVWMFWSQLETLQMFFKGDVFDKAWISSILWSTYLFKNPLILMKWKLFLDRFRRDSGRVSNDDNISMLKLVVVDPWWGLSTVYD